MSKSNTEIVKVDGFEFQYGEDEFINVTKMCKLENKRLDNAIRLKEIKNYKSALARYLKCEESKLLRVQKGGVPNHQGTYAHPLLAIRIAQWLSPEFALAVAKLTQSYLTADVSLAEDILNRATPEAINTPSGKKAASNLVDKADDNTEKFIQARLNTKKTNKELNRALSECPNVSKAVFSMSQDAIYKATYGKALKTLKKEKGLAKRESLRDDMDTDELVHLSFCESMSTKIVDKNKPKGDKKCAKTVYDTSNKVKQFETLLLNGAI